MVFYSWESLMLSFRSKRVIITVKQHCMIEFKEET